MGADLGLLAQWREDLTSEAQSAVTVLHGVAAQTDAERLFIILLAAMAIGPRDMVNEESHGHIPAQLEILAFHLYPLFHTRSTSELSLSQVEKALEASSAIMRHNTLASVMANSPRGQGLQGLTGLDDLLSWLRIEASVVRGSAYSEQTRDEICAIQGHFESWFEARIGLGPQRAAAMVNGIWTALETRVRLMGPKIHAAESLLRETWRKTRSTRHQQLEQVVHDLLKEVPTAKDASAKGRLWYLIETWS